MAHKGYTLNYFIDYFSSIPAHQWTEGTEQLGETVQHCAIGHALRNSRTTLSNTTTKTTARAEALRGFLDNNVENINDAFGRYAELGATPRGRILRALRNRKRTGNVFGTKS